MRPRTQPMDSDHEDVSQQPSTSTAGQRNRVLSSSDEEEIINGNTQRPEMSQRVDANDANAAAAQLIMAQAANKGFSREADLRKILAEKRGQFDLKGVRENLEKVLGLKLHHDETNQRYYLRTKFSIPDDMRPDRDVKIDANNANRNAFDNVEMNNFKEGILISGLMFIFMVKRHMHEGIEKEKGICATLLKNFLCEISDVREDIFKSLFGPGRLAEFVIQGWIICTLTKDANGDEEAFYDWGKRAEAVIDKKELLHSFCEIYGTQITDWPRHAEKAGIEKNNAPART
ncbi:hypothetical protein Ddc_00922 [Ditylenchus destructor]|nr:hypothetical protein Ddc_00922 [Ditylenchus destructor]